MFLGVVDYFFKSMTYHYKLLQFIAGGVKTALELTSRQWIYLMNDFINPALMVLIGLVLIQFVNLFYSDKKYLKYSIIFVGTFLLSFGGYFLTERTENYAYGGNSYPLSGIGLAYANDKDTELIVSNEGFYSLYDLKITIYVGNELDGGYSFEKNLSYIHRYSYEILGHINIENIDELKLRIMTEARNGTFEQITDLKKVGNRWEYYTIVDKLQGYGNPKILENFATENYPNKSCKEKTSFNFSTVLRQVF